MRKMITIVQASELTEGQLKPQSVRVYISKGVFSAVQTDRPGVLLLDKQQFLEELQKYRLGMKRTRWVVATANAVEPRVEDNATASQTEWDSDIPLRDQLMVAHRVIAYMGAQIDSLRRRLGE